MSVLMGEVWSSPGSLNTSYSVAGFGGKEYQPEPAPDVHVWRHTLTVLDRELPSRMLAVGRVIADLSTTATMNTSYSVAEMGGKDLLVLEASLRDVQTAGAIKSKKQVEEGMVDLIKAKYLRRLNPDAPRSAKAIYALMIPAGFTPEGLAWNIERLKEEHRARVEAAGGSVRWPKWYQEAWLMHRRHKWSGQWDPDFWTSWAERRGSIRNVGGMWIDITTGEVLSPAPKLDGLVAA